MQANMVLEKETHDLYLDPQATGSELRPWAQLERRRPQSPPPTVTHFLLQVHSYSNKATPPSRDTLYGDTVLPMTWGVIKC